MSNHNSLNSRRDAVAIATVASATAAMTIPLCVCCMRILFATINKEMTLYHLAQGLGRKFFRAFSSPGTTILFAPLYTTHQIVSQAYNSLQWIDP